MTTPGARGLDWRHHHIGPLRPCRICRRPALMRDEHLRPCHKTCAEAALTTDTGTEYGADVLDLPLAPVVDLATRRRIA